MTPGPLDQGAQQGSLACTDRLDFLESLVLLDLWGYLGDLPGHKEPLVQRGQEEGLQGPQDRLGYQEIQDILEHQELDKLGPLDLQA